MSLVCCGGEEAGKEEYMVPFWVLEMFDSLFLFSSIGELLGHGKRLLHKFTLPLVFEIDSYLAL